MYDKYNKIYPINVGTVLPKHKGMYLVTTAAATGHMAFQGYGATGGTLAGCGLTLASTSYTIFPIELYKVTSLTGLTGWLLN
jgi:hypothetical protein